MNFFDDFPKELQFVMHFLGDKCYLYEHERKYEREINNYAGWKVEAKWLLFGLYPVEKTKVKEERAIVSRVTYMKASVG